MGLPATASPLELLWTVMGLVAVCIHAQLYFESWGDERLLRQRGLNGPRHLVAHAAMRRQICKGLVQLIFAGIGVYAMTQPSNPVASVSWGATFSALSIMVAEIVLVYNAAADHVDRGRLLAMLGGRRAADSTSTAPDAPGRPEQGERSRSGS